jgi:hypothetical protein
MWRNWRLTHHSDMTPETSRGSDRDVRHTGVHADDERTAAAQRDDRVMASSGADQEIY